MYQIRTPVRGGFFSAKEMIELFEYIGMGIDMQ